MAGRRVYRTHPITEAFPALSNEDYETLKNDIEENGLLEPIWLDKKDRIIDGRHRLRACRELKIQPEFQETEYADDEVLAVVVALNLRRRHLGPSQLSLIAAKLVPYYAKAAEQRMKAGKKVEDDSEQNLSEGEEKGQASDKAGRVVGVSGMSVRHALKVEADGCDELKELLAVGGVAVSDAAVCAKETKTTQRKAVKAVLSGKAKNLKQALREMRKQEAIKEIEQLDPMRGGYPVIMADPAWPYDNRNEDATQRGQTPYPQMTLKQICDYNVPSAEDSILFLWVTNSHLANGNAERVCSAWGYQTKTIITWVKNRMGTGDWARSQTEHMVVAVRGQPKLKVVPPSVFHADVGEHSEKPEEAYKLIEECTAGAKAELFARQQRDGWSCHGHQLKELKKGEVVEFVGEAEEKEVVEEAPAEPVPMKPPKNKPKRLPATTKGAA